MATSVTADDGSRPVQNTTTARTTILSARITQFSAPSSCASLFELSGSDAITDLTKTAVVSTSDEANPKFSSCKPPGLDQHNGTLSPGVCPSDWTYHLMAPTIPVTHAYCCTRSFNYSEAICASTTLGANGTPTIYKHTPITVQWQPTDTDSFPFTLPKLLNGNYIRTWVPGETDDPNARYSGVPEPHCESFCFSKAEIVCLCLFPSLAFIAAVGGCITCCVKSSRKKKRKRLARQAELRDSTAAHAEK